MADANPDGLPPQSAEDVARFLVVSAREDRGLIRRSRPAAPEDFLNRVRDLPAMLFPNAPPRPKTPRLNPPHLNAPGATPLPHMAGIAETPIIDQTPRARAATERLELAIEAADRSEQSLLAMQAALARAHRRNLGFGVATCLVVAISLGLGTLGPFHLGRFHFGATASVPQAEAAVTPHVASTQEAAAETTPATAVAPAVDPLPVPPLPAAPELASNSMTAAPAQPAPIPTVLADDTTPATTASPSGSPAADGSQASVSPVSDQSMQPSPVEAASGDASTLLRSLPPGSIIVSPLPEPPPAPHVTPQPAPPVQDVSVNSAATVVASHPKRHYVYRRPVRYYYYGPPQLLGQVVNNLGRDIRSLFH